MNNFTFNNGPIAPALLAELLTAFQTRHNTGAFSMFAGQVRADVIAGKTVTAIDYTTYEVMAQTTAAQIMEQLTAQYELTGVVIVHSLGMVKAGELCLLVLAAATRRKAAIQACNELVERIKAELPVWGKELFADDSYQWKEHG